MHLIKQMVKPGDFLVRALGCGGDLGGASDRVGQGEVGRGPLSATCSTPSLLTPWRPCCPHTHTPSLPPVSSLPHCHSPTPTTHPPPQAIKLDVDNSPVELAFMAEVKRDPELRSLIGELFFEQHYLHRWG